MAKGKPAETPETPEPEAAPKKGRTVSITHNASGDTELRKDVIARLWTDDKMSRSDIVVHLKEHYDHVIPYQIAFAGTKGLEGGPPPKPPKETEATAQLVASVDAIFSELY